MSLSVTRPNPLVTTGDFSRRIRALEARRPGGQICWQDVGGGGGGGGGGIQFDTDPQEGGFLVLTTTEYMNFTAENFDLTTTGAAAPDGHINLNATGPVTIDSGDDTTIGGVLLTLNGGDDGVFIGSNRAGNRARLWMGATGDPAGYVLMIALDSIDLKTFNNFDIRLGTAAKAFTVYNSANAAIFRVDEDGDLHGKTGKALTFDL